MLLTMIILGERIVQGRMIEKPLTELDIHLIVTSSSPAISVTSRDNLTCLLTKGNVNDDDGSCTWRYSSHCKLHPTIRKVVVYPPDCVDINQRGIRLRDCQESNRNHPITQFLKVCTTKYKEKCEVPCPDCPLNQCRPKNQNWCETSHLVKSFVTTRQQCLEGDEERCKDPVEIRDEEQKIEMAKDCHQKNIGQHCIPESCSFEEDDEECAETTKSSEVLLTNRTCTVCQPNVVEKVTTEEVCKEGTTKDCEGDPLRTTWKKLCSTGEEKSKIVEEVDNDNNKHSNISLENLLASSLDPINDLFQSTFSQIRSNEDDTVKEEVSNKEDVPDNSIVFKFDQEIPKINLIDESLKPINETVKINNQTIQEELNTVTEPALLSSERDQKQITLPKPRGPQSLVYFDQSERALFVLNNREGTENKNNTFYKIDEITKILEEEELPPVIIQSLPSSIILENSFDTPSAAEAPSKEDSSIIVANSEVNTSTNIPTTTTQSVIPLTSPQSDTSSTTTPIESSSSPLSTFSQVTTPAKKLSNSELLRLCLLYQTGCEFNLNDESEAAEDDITTSTISSQTVNTDFRIPKEILEIQAQRHLGCAFGGCDEDDKSSTNNINSVNTVRTNTISLDNKERLESQLKCLFAGTCKQDNDLNLSDVITRTPVTLKSARVTSERSDDKSKYSNSVQRLTCLFKSTNC